MRHLLARLPLLAKDQRGAVAIIFSLAILPAIALVGAVVDYGMAAGAKAQIQAAADAAALAAVRTYVDLAPNDSTNAAAVSEAKRKAAEKGQTFFESNTSQFYQGASAIIAVTPNGRTVTASVNYSAGSRANFSKILGFAGPIRLRGTAQASITLPSYANIYLLIDVSQSMGIAASKSDMQTLAGLTPNKCVFGCHVANPADFIYVDPKNPPPSNEKIAQDNGIKLRIDLVRDATKKMIASAKSLAVTNNIRFAILSMQYDDAKIVANLSSNYVALSALADKIDLGTPDAGGSGESELATPLATLTNILPKSGDGESPANVKNYVFILTDGVRDIYNPHVPWGHEVSAFDSSWCEGFKSTKQATVGVIYTTYYPVPKIGSSIDQAYWDLVDPIIDGVRPNLKKCASVDFFFEAKDGPEIEDKMMELFRKTVSTSLVLSK